MDIDNPSVPVTGDNDVIPSVGDENAMPDNSSTSEALNLKDLVQQATGRVYATDEDALKGIKETYQFATKRVSTPITSNPADFDALRQRVEVSEFYAERPELKNHKELIETFAKAKNLSREEVIQTDDFKNVLGKIKIAEEVESSKSVLQSNPRLGVVRSKIDVAKEAVKAGDQQTANQNAVDAVLGAYDMK